MDTWELIVGIFILGKYQICPIFLMKFPFSSINTMLRELIHVPPCHRLIALSFRLASQSLTKIATK